MSVYVEINENKALLCTSREVAEQYAWWAFSRGGYTPGTLVSPAYAECSDRNHAEELLHMLTDWGVPKTALRIREAIA